MIERRKQLRADYLETQLLAAAIREEMSETLEPGSEPHKKVLAEAAELYDQIYKKYRTRMAGLYARMFQGRANRKLGKLQDALGYYSELLDQPDEPDEFRVLKTKTLRLALDGWLDPAEKKYVEAIKRGSDWVMKSRPTDDRSLDWLAIRLSLAKAYKMQADEADPMDKRTINQSLTEARRQAQFVAGKRSEFQEEAKRLVADLGGPDRTGERPDPRNFEEAQRAGTDSLDAIQTAELVVARVPKRIAAEKDDNVKAELEKQLSAAQQTLATAADDAMHYYNLALNLADETTSIKDINVVRYFLCYLYYQKGEYFKAALLGDFVSRRYPDSAGARDCARISLASYMSIFNQEQSEDKLFETDHIVATAEYIADKWPEQPETEEALDTLVRFMIDAGELDRAQGFLSRIPETSPRRGASELKTGRAMWGRYLQGAETLRMAEADGNSAGIDISGERTRLNELKLKAKEILAAGYGRIPESAKPDRAMAIALLSLAQANLETQQTAECVAVLEHPSLGPLTLVNKKASAVSDAAVTEEIYKTALAGYISSLDGGPEASGAIDKAKGIMDQMKSTIGGTPQGEKRLIAVYVNLAQDLEAQLASATPDAKRSLSQGFETFLRQISDGASDQRILRWVADSFANLGRSLDDGQTLNEDAKKYYQASVDAFQNILDKVQLEPPMKVEMQTRMASVLSEMRDFEKAIGIFEEILATNALRLDVQVQATKAIELWAKQPGQEAKYMDAIRGVRKGGKQLIWGWGQIANKTAGNKKYEDRFHEARLHVAECRLSYAQSQSGNQQAKLLKDAVRDISVTKRLYPNLGGEKWSGQYDALLKRIQAAKGDRAIGLKAFETASTAGASRK